MSFDSKPREASIVPSKQCLTMADVRAGIDELDRQLVHLIALRQGYIEAAARIKERHDEVRLEWRIEEVVTKVLASAEREGLSKRIAEPVWRELIDRSIDHEFETWEKIRDTSPVEK